MRISKKVMLLTVCFCALLSAVVIYAAPRASSGWNVYDDYRTVYANVGVTYVSDTSQGKGWVSYTARVLGEDADKVISDNAAQIKITGQDGKVYCNKEFWYGNNVSGSFRIGKEKNSYVSVYVLIEGNSNTKDIALD